MTKRRQAGRGDEKDDNIYASPPPPASSALVELTYLKPPVLFRLGV